MKQDEREGGFWRSNADANLHQRRVAIGLPRLLIGEKCSVADLKCQAMFAQAGLIIIILWADIF